LYSVKFARTSYDQHLKNTQYPILSGPQHCKPLITSISTISITTKQRRPIISSRIISFNIRTGPEPACGISIGVAKKAVRDWTDRNHKKYWESTTGLRQANGFISGPSARRMKDL
jgi:hypothetical protein